MSTNVNLSQNRLALISVMVCTIIFSIQDIWIAKIVTKVDPLLLTFWIFLCVTCFSVPVALIKRESFRVSKNSVNDLIGLNITTFISWVFTFLALSESSPAVVGAGTLSAPLLIILIFLDKNKFKVLESVSLILFITIGLLIGSIENNIHIVNFKALTYCLLASLGVVGNSFFMKNLNKFHLKGNVVLSLRFILLIFGLGSYFITTSKDLSDINLNLIAVTSIGLLTSYFPLLILYFAHIHLSIFIINLLLALTPVSSILILGTINGFNSLNLFHLISITMILSGVYYGYLMEAKREKA